MNYLGKGFLIGYKTYKKDNVDRHIYYVLNGNKDLNNDLYSDLEFLTILQDTQTIEELKPQNVTFEISSRTFGGQVKNLYMNIKADKE